MSDKAARDYIATGTQERRRNAFVRLVAENMASYANCGLSDEAWLPQAGALVRSFEAIEGRTPNDYLELETWSASHLGDCGRFLVFDGGNAKA